MAVKQDLVLLTIINFLFIPFITFSQKTSTDTVAFKKDFERLLKKYKINSKGYSINVTSFNQKRGQTAFIITNNYYNNASKLLEKKFEEELNNLTINNPNIYLPALTYIQQYKEQLTKESHYAKLIEALKKTDVPRYETFQLLLQGNFPAVDQFLKDLVLDTTIDSYKGWAIMRFLTISKEQKLDFYISYLKPVSLFSSVKFFMLIDSMSKFNKQLLLQILNSEEATFICFRSDNRFYYQNAVEVFKEDIRKRINGILSPQEINSSYFFTFKPPWIEWYDDTFKRHSDWYHLK